MLTFIDSDHRYNRRSFLKIGSLALGGLSLPGLLAARAGDANKLVTDKSVIFLFLHGGPSQTETFDPKMTAPAEIRSTSPARCRLPFPASPSAAPSRGWPPWPTSSPSSAPSCPATPTTTSSRSSCRDTFGANLGSIYARVAGINHPVTGMPTNVILFPRAVDPSTPAGHRSFGNFGATGPFGSRLRPLRPQQRRRPARRTCS